MFDCLILNIDYRSFLSANTPGNIRTVAWSIWKVILAMSLSFQFPLRSQSDFISWLFSISKVGVNRMEPHLAHGKDVLQL